MSFGAEEYDKIIEILNRNPLIPISNLSTIKGISQSDVSNLFSEIREAYVDEEAIDKFVQNTSRELDPILFVNGILKSIIKDSLDQSSSLGDLFNKISNHYSGLESETIPEAIRYSKLYKYFVSLIKNEDLPVLNNNESAILLSLLQEITDFEQKVMASEEEDVSNFHDTIQSQIAQYLLKVAVPMEKWNEVNEKEFLSAYKLPLIEDEEINEDLDSVLKHSQQNVAMFSLNPFSVEPGTRVSLKEMLIEIQEKDLTRSRDIKKICNAVGANPDNPLVYEATDSNLIIVSQPSVEPSKFMTSKISSNDLDTEREICKRMSRHDIIDMEAYKKSLQGDLASVSKSNSGVGDAPPSKIRKKI